VCQDRMNLVFRQPLDVVGRHRNTGVSGDDVLKTQDQ
jgi:hypothetical protein